MHSVLVGWALGFLYILFKMGNAKEGGSVNRPLVLDGPNYDYWKARMIVFLKSMDNKT